MKLLNNKKGGEFKAGQWLVLLVIYFMFFILIANGVNNMFLEIPQSNISVNNENFVLSGFIGQKICDTPRYQYNPETLERTEYTKVQNDHLACDESVGVKSQNTCNNINGCSWDNVTSGFWFWESVEYQSCLGTINASYFGIDTGTQFIGDVVASHENSDTFGVITPCNHPNVIQNKSLCEMFSCSWETVEISDEYTSSASVIDTVKELFTFRYSFGFSNESLNYFLTFIFFIIPLIMIAVTIYMLIPFAH